MPKSLAQGDLSRGRAEGGNLLSKGPTCSKRVRVEPQLTKLEEASLTSNKQQLVQQLVSEMPEFDMVGGGGCPEMWTRREGGLGFVLVPSCCPVL